MDTVFRPNRLRKTLIGLAEQHKRKNVGILVSSGVDSQSILFACREAGIKPTCFSFTRDDYESTDYFCGAAIAKHFGLQHVKVPIKTNVKSVARRLFDVISKYKLTLQTDIECLSIIKPAIEVMSEYGLDVVLTGHAADTYFGSSRRAAKFRDGREHLFREKMIADPNWSQRSYLTSMCKELGMKYDPPYQHPKISKLFENTTYKEVNQPGEKFVTREAFKDYFVQVPQYVHKHMNYQCGTSRFKEMFAALVDSELNIRNHKTPRGIYNDIINGRVKPR